VRLGVLADVHANLHGLRAAVGAVRRAGVDRWLVAGDLVGYGPQPDECVAEIAALDPVCVAGNHDLIAVGRLSSDRCIRLARESLEWTRSVISAETRDYLAGLPLRAEVDGVVIAHGSLDDPQEYTLHAEQARRQLAAIGDAGVLVLGHTHKPWAVDAAGATLATSGQLRLAPATLLNPGAVGQSRDRRAVARAAVIDLDAGTAELLAVEFDAAGCRAALRRAGLPPQSCHLKPTPLRAARRVAGGALRRAGLRVARFG
jgi:predicted phosphodiesterase